MTSGSFARIRLSRHILIATDCWGSLRYNRKPNFTALPSTPRLQNLGERLHLPLFDKACPFIERIGPYRLLKTVRWGDCLLGFGLRESGEYIVNLLQVPFVTECWVNCPVEHHELHVGRTLRVNQEHADWLSCCMGMNL